MVALVTGSPDKDGLRAATEPQDMECEAPRRDCALVLGSALIT